MTWKTSHARDNINNTIKTYQISQNRGGVALVSSQMAKSPRNSPFYLLILVDGLEVSRAGFEPATNGDIARTTKLDC
jgi:hypothetical protein